ncbi:hypothetical protein LUZ63_019408 [Rhynchospora breviuscula]|uniref:Transcription repressor n=1 Tax=Rhynchospora breviuscula TaxID=2022672 RepID=A0A9Q0HJG9_9POAL|nr:hypothetical protein LUZ63_019408 [Rhynchospora breviuscula]
MKWGRKRTQQENSTEKKSFSLSDLFSLSWLSKLRSNNKPQSNNTSPKFHSCKPKCVSKNQNRIPSTKLNSPPSSPHRMSTDQSIAPRRRSVGDEDRPLPIHHKRHYSVGGDHIPASSSITLGNVIPFSVVPKSKQNIPHVCPLHRSLPDSRLHQQKIWQRRRRVKNGLVIANSDSARRKSFNGRIRPRKQHRVSARSVRRGRKDLENFAMVKKSIEPERDFKKSMVEMILETGIRRPEELESLLACYLTLNSDEHHHVIVKVFRQVCFEINLKQFGRQSIAS